MKILNRFYPHFLAIIGFVLIAIIYFYPVLQGKQLFQSDIAQYAGMAKEQNDFRAAEKTEPFWTNAAFGGMPTYQLGAKYPNDWIGHLDDLLRFLPRPADYLFLYFLGFYALLLVLKADPLKAFFGALAFGFSTYMIIILGVGHNAKAHAIAYMPLVIAGFIMVFRKKYVLGGIVMMLATALEINANHFQMTYYMLILLLALSVYFIWTFIKEKDFKGLAKVIGVFAVTGILALGANAANLMATSEYTNFSMRGKSELSFNADGSKNTENSSMSHDYITQYSYGIAESLDLIAPRLFGGSNEPLDKDSKVVKFLQTQQVAENQYISEEQAIEYAKAGLPTYWGDQPSVAAPAYIGAIVFFLAVLALFNDKRKIKWAFLAGAIVSLLLSFGKNLSWLTDFFIDYVPLYDKFRAVSSIQVILELCLPVLAIMGLTGFFKADKDEQWHALKKSAITCLGLIVALFLFKGLFTFEGINDGALAKQMDPAFLTALIEDRKAMYTADLLRSGFLILIAALLLWLHTKNKLSQTFAVALVGVLMVGDLVLIDKNYVNAKEKSDTNPIGFVSKREMTEPFTPNEADLEIMKDTSVYRVYEFAGRLQARTSYFHKSVGGYSAVRPRRYDQLFDYQVDRKLADIGKSIDPQTLKLTQNVNVLDMLNIKYLILQVGEGQSVSITNSFINGNAWFVKKIETVKSADEEMKALDYLDTKNAAVINTADVKPGIAQTFTTDSLATIKLQVYKPNYIKYTSNNNNPGLAVFSEVYYPNGWNVYVDGKESNHFRVDYVLRGMTLPAGKHTVEFKFEPSIVKTGGTIALISSIGMILLIGGGVYFENKKKSQNV
ncbi:YfhO family protein [Flavobacterium sp. 3HN19-14]|uniref:YfhO family protein n=1 Tax=Flavobacterium sp. 3HN19-14 TaxID=3448133 RepID=UPI003EE37396